MRLQLLINKFKRWELNNENALTASECMEILELEEQVEYDVYCSVMDYMDHLTIEGV